MCIYIYTYTMYNIHTNACMRMHLIRKCIHIHAQLFFVIELKMDELF